MTDSKDGQTNTISIKEAEADCGSLPKGKATVRGPLAAKESMYEHQDEEPGLGQTKTFYLTEPGMPHRDRTPD